MKIRVKSVHSKIDLRKLHKTRNHYRRGLTEGEARLIINKAQTICRLIDFNANFYSLYAKKGHIWSTNEIIDALQRGLSVSIDIPTRRTTRKAA